MLLADVVLYFQIPWSCWTGKENISICPCWWNDIIKYLTVKQGDFLWLDYLLLKQGPRAKEKVHHLRLSVFNYLLRCLVIFATTCMWGWKILLHSKGKKCTRSIYIANGETLLPLTTPLKHGKSIAVIYTQSPNWWFFCQIILPFIVISNFTTINYISYIVHKPGNTCHIKYTPFLSGLEMQLQKMYLFILGGG